MRLPHSLKSTHWVMWSSPVLLLVLVFTWTASSSSTPPRHLDTLSVTPATTQSTTASHAPPTTIPVTTTTSAPTRTRKQTLAHAARRTDPTKSPVVSSLSTSAVRVKSSSSSTASSVKSSVNESAANASSGVVSGQLGPSLSVADVPLQGPGTWEVAASAPATVTLICAGTPIPVDQQFVIAAHTTCQVTITAEAPNQFVTWELTPIN